MRKFLQIPSFSWAPYPFIRFFVAYVLGVLCYIFLQPSTQYLPFILGGMFVVYLVVKLIVKDAQFYKINIFLGVFGLIFLFLSGIFVANIKNEILSDNHFSKYDTNKYLGKINAVSNIKNNDLQTEISIIAVWNNNQWHSTKGKCLVKFKNIVAKQKLPYGTEFIFSKKPQEVENAGNPYEFDYKAYLSYNNVYHRINLTEEDFQISALKPENIVYEYSLKSSFFLDSILQTHIHSAKELGIARALFLGIKDGLDNELRQAYSSAGAMHVLAVSGMHVAILFQLLSLFLQRISFFKKNNLLTGLILLVFVWFYAFITGGSASVLRAVVMFSFTILAKIFDKRTNIYNTLAMSALALTLYDPYLIMSVGFQLSYLAVIGIVYIYPKINALFEFKHWLKKWIWDIICISVAAQIATFPISVVYFHQFPTYFILSNLFVIPVAMMVMYSGIALFFTSFIPPVSIFIGYITEKAIWIMNYGILFTEKLPFPLIEGLFITVLECVFIYLIIWTFISAFQKKEFKYLYLSTFFTVCFALSSSSRIIQNSKKEVLVFYNHYSGFFGQYINGSESVILANENLSANENSIDYISKPVNLRYGMFKPPIIETESEKNEEIRFAEKRILIINNALNDMPEQIQSDYLYWNDRNTKSFEKILKTMKCKWIIVSPKVSIKQHQKLYDLANINQYNIHFIKKGALEIML
jgi:competence protein ComEC